MKMLNSLYARLLRVLETSGNYQVTRGAGVKSSFGYNFGAVSYFPILTLRKTAWKTALKELEWFMSGDETCPEGVLSDVWWKGQLSPDNTLRQGYPTQLRNSPAHDGSTFDQIAWLRKEIKDNPTSRRLCLTVWNPATMANFTAINENPMAPTCCHLAFNQFQVIKGELRMNAIFRSTDAILGLPHNFVQHRALQLYFAHHAGVPAANFYNLFMNDVHYYDHPDHNRFVNWLMACDMDGVHALDYHQNDLIYTPSSVEFKAEDFTTKEKLRTPLYTNKIERTL
jgi:thymidylate synthase